mgnify:CR=1 FL=1
MSVKAEPLRAQADSQLVAGPGLEPDVDAAKESIGSGGG